MATGSSTLPDNAASLLLISSRFLGSTFGPFCFKVPLLKLNIRIKGTLIMKGLLGNLVISSISMFSFCFWVHAILLQATPEKPCQLLLRGFYHGICLGVLGLGSRDFLTC